MTSLVGIFFGNTTPTEIILGEYANIEFDAVLAENHSWSADATTNPVETGSPITDHVIEQADTLTIAGFVSDASISLSSNFTQFSGDQPKTKVAFDALREAIKAKKTVSVYTKFKVYTDMIITKIDIPRVPENGGSIEFSIDFLNIRMVSTQLVDIPTGIGTSQTDSSTTKKASTQSNAGTKSATTTTATKPSSVISRFFN